MSHFWQDNEVADIQAEYEDLLLRFETLVIISSKFAFWDEILYKCDSYSDLFLHAEN